MCIVGNYCTTIHIVFISWTQARLYSVHIVNVCLLSIYSFSLPISIYVYNKQGYIFVYQSGEHLDWGKKTNFICNNTFYRSNNTHHSLILPTINTFLVGLHKSKNCTPSENIKLDLSTHYDEDTIDEPIWLGKCYPLHYHTK